MRAEIVGISPMKKGWLIGVYIEGADKLSKDQAKELFEQLKEEP